MLKLRYYQKEAIEKFFKYVSANHGKNPLIVLPTAAGKSLVQAHIVKHVLDDPGTRILLLTHQQELIKQNYSELIENFDNDLFLDAGIYSAGLNSRDIKNRIIFAGIQSIYKKAADFGKFDLILIDECHRVPATKTGMYRKFLDDMYKINNKIVIGGLSATPYRMKTGLLTEGEDKIFDDICYECSILELVDPSHFKNWDKKQYLCKIISKNSVVKTDLSKIRVQAGEFVKNEMQDLFNVDQHVKKAVNEIIEYTKNRKKVLIFTCGIKHAENVYNYLNSEKAGFIHSKQSQKINDEIINNFKNGDLKFLINIDILTTGFNEKKIDCIVMLRATLSPGLYSQIAGRGLRMHPDKENCLFLDYGGNILRHGAIDNIEIRPQLDKNWDYKPPVKECPKCHTVCHIALLNCPDCNFLFPEPDRNKHDETASSLSILTKYKKPEKYNVLFVEYSRHFKAGKPDSVRVDYFVNEIVKFSEWVCIEHEGFAKKKAVEWLKKRILDNITIKNVDDFLKYKKYINEPEKIIIDENERFPKIISYIFPKKEKTKLDYELEALF